jgi:hypothetical protein
VNRWFETAAEARLNPERATLVHGLTWSWHGEYWTSGTAGTIGHAFAWPPTPELPSWHGRVLVLQDAYLPWIAPLGPGPDSSLGLVHPSLMSIGALVVEQLPEDGAGVLTGVRAAFVPLQNTTMGDT